MNVLALDTETTIWNNGNAFDRRNYLVCSSFASDAGMSGCVQHTEGIQSLVDSSDLLVGFNFKFDYHHLKKAGIKLEHKQIWDCQVAEFILTNQTQKYPSLNGCAEKYLGEQKLDVVERDYWSKGINTDQIPWEILSAYAEKDAILTLKVYQQQYKAMTPAQRQLMRLQMMDTHILAEMEWNGLVYDVELCNKRAEELDNKIQTINTELRSVYPNVPINFNSGDHLSAFLYGGVVKEDSKEHIGFFKSGLKAGQPKYKNVVVEHQLPRLVQPLKGSELKKEGIFGTSEDVLKKLKGGKKHISRILELSKLDKLNGTYYRGLPKLNAEMNWEEGVLHGQLNQCVAATGRLSANKPNQQNFASEMLDVFITRFKD